MHNVYFTFTDEEEHQLTSEETTLYYVEVIPRIGETVLIGKTTELSPVEEEVLRNKHIYEYNGGLVINVVHNIIEDAATDDTHRIDVFVKKQIKGGNS